MSVLSVLLLNLLTYTTYNFLYGSCCAIFLGVVAGTFLLLGLLTFVYPLVGYFFLGATSYWIVETSIRSLPYVRKGIYVLLGLGLFGGLLLFALLFSSCPDDTGLGLIVLPMAVILLCNSLSRPLLEKKSDNKMKS